MGKTKVYVIEDNRIFRDGITAIINAQADLEVVAASAGNHDSLQQAQRLKPHVVLVDFGLRNENGLRIVAASFVEGLTPYSSFQPIHPAVSPGTFQQLLERTASVHDSRSLPGDWADRTGKDVVP